MAGQSPGFTASASADVAIISAVQFCLPLPLPLPLSRPLARYLTRLRETRRPGRATDNPNYTSLGGTGSRATEITRKVSGATGPDGPGHKGAGRGGGGVAEWARGREMGLMRAQLRPAGRPNWRESSIARTEETIK